MSEMMDGGKSWNADVLDVTVFVLIVQAKLSLTMTMPIGVTTA